MLWRTRSETVRRTAREVLRPLSGGRMILERSYLPHATFGRLTVDSFSCYTVECPWEDNKPFVSCLPEGVYELVNFWSVKWRNTYCLINHDMGVYGSQSSRHHENAKRWACLFHPANYAAQLQGCVAPGNKFGVVDGHWSVTNSRYTFDKLLSAINGSSERQLEVKTYRPVVSGGAN